MCVIEIDKLQIMISKKNEQYIRSLSLKKFRQKYNNFIIEGDKMVGELLSQAPHRIDQLYALPCWIDQHARRLNKSGISVGEVNERELKKISSLKTPNQVLAVVRQWEPDLSLAQLETSLSLYLDGIQNPGNMGTILRTADWFGIDWVICSPDSVDRFSPKVVQATMGALFSIKCVTRKFEDLSVEKLNLPIYGAILKGEDIFRTSLKPKGLIVIGNEGQGIRSEVLPFINHPVSIPAHQAARGTESLNAAIATAIICAAFRGAGGKE